VAGKDKNAVYYDFFYHNKRRVKLVPVQAIISIPSVIIVEMDG
jgi:hypothetical protein